MYVFRLYILLESTINLIIITVLEIVLLNNNFKKTD